MLAVCPQCGASNGTNLSDGRRLCFECRHEWNPDDVPAIVVGDAVVPAPNIDAVLGPPADVLAEREAQQRLDGLIGTFVILEGGQLARIEAFVDDDHVTVSLGGPGDDEREETVSFSDIVRSVEPQAAPAEVDTETARQLAAANSACAGMILQAGLATVQREDGRSVVVQPPTGWLPKNSKAWAVVEMGAAYAVGVLVHAFELPADQVAAMAAELIDNAEQTEKGGSL